MLIGAFVLPWVLYFNTQQIFFAALGVAAPLIDLSTAVIKRLTGHYDFGKRPDGACGCDIFCVGPNVSGRPGFPSGHATVSTFVSAVLCWWYPDATVYGVVYVLLTCIARYAKKCHSVLQLIVGVIYGLLAAYAFITIYKVYIHGTRP